MRDNLVLQQRMSRSGKVIHRWVRPSPAVPGASALPSATVSRHPRRSEWLGDLQRLVGEWYDEVYSAPFDEGDPEWVAPGEFRRRLGALDDSVLRAAHGLVMERQGAGFEDMLGASLLKEDDTSTALYVLYLARLEDDARGLDLEMSATFGDVPMDYVTARSAHSGLLGYGLDLPADPFAAPAADQQRIEALVRLLEALYEADMSAHVDLDGVGLDGHAKLRDHRLAQLVYERPEEHGRIARIIIERNSADVDMIRAILDSDSAALADGAL